MFTLKYQNATENVNAELPDDFLHQKGSNQCFNK